MKKNSGMTAQTLSNSNLKRHSERSEESPEFKHEILQSSCPV